MAIVYLGLGSNLGDCLSHLREAVKALSLSMTILKCSSILKNSPLYVANQPDFYNQVLKVRTSLSPMELLALIQQVEKKLGRTPTFRYGPRVVDIDILYYDQLLFQNKSLEIPHQKNNERHFVISLMAEVDPHFSCPKTGIVMGDSLPPLHKKAALAA